MAVYQNLTLTQLSQDIPGNTSQVRVVWESVQTGGSYNDVRHTAKVTVTVNGTKLQTESVTYSLPYGQKSTIFDRVFTVSHDDMGQAALTVNTWMDTHISAGVVELKKTLNLTQIPRPTTLTAPNTQIGYLCRIQLSPKYPGTQHTLSFRFGSRSGYIDGEGKISESPVVLSANSVLFAVPEDFYQEIPDSLTGVCSLTCTTWLAGSQIGQPQTSDFTVQADEGACWPLVSCQMVDVNPVTVAVTGNDRLFIQGVSNASCTLDAETFHCATAAVRKIGSTVLDPGQDSLVIEGIREIPTFSVTDSRGLEDHYKPKYKLIDYRTPTCKASLVRLHPTDGTASLSLEGQWYGGELGLSDNALFLSYRIGDGQWQTLTPVLTGNAYTAQVTLTDMAYDRLYNLTVAVSDLLTREEKQLVLKKSIPVFDWGENDFRFHVPVAMESLTVGGKTLTDLLYPVGSVYISTAETAPNLLFGGVWEQLPERFLLGAGSRYPALSQGGEERHTLTLAEMPAHSHTSYGWAFTNDTQGSIALRADGQAEDYKTRSSGGGEGHNNMPPYLAVYMWKRVK